MAPFENTVTIPEWFQGPTGAGQGGWTASRFATVIDQPVTVSLRAPVPLDAPLEVEEHDDRWQLVDHADDGNVVVLEAEPWEPSFAATSSVPIEQARAARTRFPMPGDLHPVPHCFSCGLQHDSMHVHAGPLGDGRFATDWRVPSWAADSNGVVDDGVLWAALDCTAAWYACCEPETRTAFTVQYAVEVTQPLVPEATYSLVGWQGDFVAGWDGRKRGAASAAFDEYGSLVAHAHSFWVSVA